MALSRSHKPAWRATIFRHGIEGPRIFIAHKIKPFKQTNSNVDLWKLSNECNLLTTGCFIRTIRAIIYVVADYRSVNAFPVSASSLVGSACSKGCWLRCADIDFICRCGLPMQRLFQKNIASLQCANWLIAISYSGKHNRRRCSGWGDRHGSWNIIIVIIKWCETRLRCLMGNAI